jgi:hypothetical protein
VTRSIKASRRFSPPAFLIGLIIRMQVLVLKLPLIQTDINIVVNGKRGLS